MGCFQGRGKAILDGVEREIQVGDVLTMHAGCRHTVMATKDKEKHSL